MFSIAVIIYEFHPSSSLYVIEMLAVAACVSVCQPNQQFSACDREFVRYVAITSYFTFVQFVLAIPGSNLQTKMAIFDDNVFITLHVPLSNVKRCTMAPFRGRSQ